MSLRSFVMQNETDLLGSTNMRNLPLTQVSFSQWEKALHAW